MRLGTGMSDGLAPAPKGQWNEKKKFKTRPYPKLDKMREEEGYHPDN
jgi:hypothetical protein